MADSRPLPGGEGHAPTVLGQNHRIGRVGLGAAQRLCESVHQLGVQHGHLDQSRRIQSQRQIQRVNAGGLQRNAYRGVALRQPDEKRLVTAGAVGKLALGDSMIRLDQGHRQRTGADIDATKNGCG